jgi:hypothetical protein
MPGHLWVSPATGFCSRFATLDLKRCSGRTTKKNSQYRLHWVRHGIGTAQTARRWGRQHDDDQAHHTESEKVLAQITRRATTGRMGL